MCVLELHIEQGPCSGPRGGPPASCWARRRAACCASSGRPPTPGPRPSPCAAMHSSRRPRPRWPAGTSPPVTRRRGWAWCVPVGTVSVEPAIVTAVPGVCEISLDQRAFDRQTLQQALAEAREAAARAAESNRVSVEWRHVWRIDPCRFDPGLVELCAEAVQEITGDAPRLASGPLHDAVEMARVMPSVMMFARSPNGLSHCKEEDTPDADLEVTIDAFQRLVDKTVASVAAGRT
ncbi:MAG: M20/M25/M40 family metallo-hydrolase [Vicinamibacterales bacterium]